jgi:hypothetical protein
VKPSEKHSDSAFYATAAKEIQAGNIDVGLMAKAVHQAKGNKKESELLYLGWRVELLKEEALERANAEKTVREELQRQEKEAKKQKELELPFSERPNFIAWVLVLFFLAFVFIIIISSGF